MNLLSSDVVIIITLILAALVLLVLEIVTPSFGLLTLAAIISAGIAIIMAFSINTLFGWELLIGMVILIPVALVFLVKVVPDTWLGSRLFLPKAPSADKDATPQADELAAMVGMEGVAATILRPVGVIKVNGKRIDARSDSDFIEPGAKIKVISATGTDVVVREVKA